MQGSHTDQLEFAIKGLEMSTGKRKFENAVVKAVVKKARTGSSSQEAKVKRMVSKILRMRGLTPEVKYFTYSLTSNMSNSVGNLDFLLNGLTQGVDETNRIGDHINIMSIEIRGYIQNGGGAAFDAITYALVIDKQINGSITGAAALPTSTTAAPFFYNTNAAGAAWVKNENWDKRFKILKQVQKAGNQQVVYVTGGTTVQPESYVVCDFVLFHKFTSPLRVEYLNSTGASTSVATNAPVFCYGNTAGNTSSMNYQVIVRYTDT